MNKLILVPTFSLLGIGSIGAQDVSSETFRIFKPDYVSFHTAGFCQVGEEFVLTYSSIDDDGDDIDYHFGLSQPYVTPDSVSGVYDEIEDGGEITYLRHHLQGIPVKYPSNGIYIKVENNRSSIIRL